MFCTVFLLSQLRYVLFAIIKRHFERNSSDTVKPRSIALKCLWDIGREVEEFKLLVVGRLISRRIGGPQQNVDAERWINGVVVQIRGINLRSEVEETSVRRST